MSCAVQASAGNPSTGSYSLSWSLSPLSSLEITSPADGASPQSAFVAVAGTGPAGVTLDVLLNGSSIGTVSVDSEGKWEALPFVGGSGTIQVQDSSASSNIITVDTLPPSFSPSPEVPVSTSAFLPLRHADIFIDSGRVPDKLSKGLISQYFLYGPLYTHTALYLSSIA